MYIFLSRQSEIGFHVVCSYALSQSCTPNQTLRAMSSVKRADMLKMNYLRKRKRNWHQNASNNLEIKMKFIWFLKILHLHFVVSINYSLYTEWFEQFLIWCFSTFDWKKKNFFFELETFRVAIYLIEQLTDSHTFTFHQMYKSCFVSIDVIKPCSQCRRHTASHINDFSIFVWVLRISCWIFCRK